MEYDIQVIIITTVFPTPLSYYFLALRVAFSESPDGAADRNSVFAQKESKGPAVAQEYKAKYKIQVEI